MALQKVKNSPSRVPLCFIKYTVLKKVNFFQNGTFEMEGIMDFTKGDR